MPKSNVPVVSVTVPSALNSICASSFARRCRYFQKVADAEAAQLAAFAAFALAGGKALDVGEFERLLGQLREVAAVIGHVGRGLVRQLFRPDLIALAQREPIDAHLGCGRVDHPLHEVVALGPAGAAIRAGLRGIGENALGRHFDQRRPVHALHVFHDVDRAGKRPHRRKKRAHVGEALDADGEEGAVLIKREFGGDAMVAAVTVGEKASRAVVGPLHRPAQSARRVQYADVF